MFRYFVVSLTFKRVASQDEGLAQRQFLQDLVERDVLILAGPLADSPGHGLAIVRAGSLVEARTIYEGAPIIKKDIASWAIDEINVSYKSAALSE
ncbi:MAG: hypothetical protein JWO83_1927 [Caulobacteraceae bacterium]|nr:hypothetical protein [Caulobacteraceae bacterium]